MLIAHSSNQIQQAVGAGEHSKGFVRGRWNEGMMPPQICIVIASSHLKIQPVRNLHATCLLCTTDHAGIEEPRAMKRRLSETKIVARPLLAEG